MTLDILLAIGWTIGVLAGLPSAIVLGIELGDWSAEKLRRAWFGVDEDQPKR